MPSEGNTMTERDCKHGRLARSCETCAMEEDIDDLKYELGVAREAQQCECSSDDACRFARERDALVAELEALRIPDGFRVFPDWKGYALLGTGNYIINHSATFDEALGAELIITLATDADRPGNRQIGESRTNQDDAPPIHPDDMVIRIGFISERGLFALEDQLSCVRKEFFPGAKEKTE